ncbi:heterocyst-inhibiting protein PatX [Baaleninema sp.]|uniref:heterocyst-inhibiting protein PatX n=1 Tax=Baaleninema sp. TaxID=3101197 RepID=UPI003D06ED3F
MRIYSSILLSSLLLVGFAANARAIESVSSNVRVDNSIEVLSTDKSNTDTVPHRGSGR